jgi:acetoin utilization deacetylase AcuC-like enzyme
MTSFFQHPFYPYSGTASTATNMVNVPLAAGSGGVAVRRAFDEHWAPAFERFRPQMIFISAGFDAHREDLLGGMSLIEADYAWLTRSLMDVAGTHSHGRIVSMLEGGYHLEALGRSAVAHVKTLSGHRLDLVEKSRTAVYS